MVVDQLFLHWLAAHRTLDHAIWHEIVVTVVFAIRDDHWRPSSASVALAPSSRLPRSCMPDVVLVFHICVFQLPLLLASLRGLLFLVCARQLHGLGSRLLKAHHDFSDRNVGRQFVARAPSLAARTLAVRGDASSYAYRTEGMATRRDDRVVVELLADFAAQGNFERFERG